jgi:hypothetical protein
VASFNDVVALADGAGALVLLLGCLLCGRLRRLRLGRGLLSGLGLGAQLGRTLLPQSAARFSGYVCHEVCPRIGGYGYGGCFAIGFGLEDGKGGGTLGFGVDGKRGGTLGLSRFGGLEDGTGGGVGCFGIGFDS